MKQGKLIVIEGACDGIGKSTQQKTLTERLKGEGNKVTTHHFPSYKTYHGLLVEKYLSGEYGRKEDLSAYFINSLYAIDRKIAWGKILSPRYEKGDIILLDRYTTSSLIYQSALIEDLEERKKFIEYVIDFEYNKLQIQEPDKTIFLSAPFDLVTKLRNERKQNNGEIIENDIHENDLTYMKKVYDNAMFVAEYLSWNKIECNNGNKMKSIEEIHEEIYKTIYEDEKIERKYIKLPLQSHPQHEVKTLKRVKKNSCGQTNE